MAPWGGGSGGIPSRSWTRAWAGQSPLDRARRWRRPLALAVPSPPLPYPTPGRTGRDPGRLWARVMCTRGANARGREDRGRLRGWAGLLEGSRRAQVGGRAGGRAGPMFGENSSRRGLTRTLRPAAARNSAPWWTARRVGRQLQCELRVAPRGRIRRCGIETSLSRVVAGAATRLSLCLPIRRGFRKGARDATSVTLRSYPTARILPFVRPRPPPSLPPFPLRRTRTRRESPVPAAGAAHSRT